MKKQLKRQEDEPLYKWIERIAKALNMTDEQYEAMSEVSKVSYTAGGNALVKSMQKIINKKNI